MENTKTILITGAGSGFGEGSAIGLAKLGHKSIAGVQISPQVTALRQKVNELGLQNNIEVIKLDILDKYDVRVALKYDIDVLFSNAGIGESGPVFEIPLDLVRNNYETNVFAPLDLSQQFINKWINAGKKGKIVFTSSMGGLFTPSGYGIFVSTKHALEAIAEDDVVIEGWVPDVSAVYDTARVFIAPLQSGAGIKGKVLGALAHGIPTVLSTVAAEGISLKEGVDAFVATKPEEWVFHIAKLYLDKKLWQSTSEHAMAFAKANFGFEKGVKQMKESLETGEIFTAYDNNTLAAH